MDQAKQEHAELVVFPEYVLGHIDVPGPETIKFPTPLPMTST